MSNLDNPDDPDPLVYDGEADEPALFHEAIDNGADTLEIPAWLDPNAGVSAVPAPYFSEGSEYDRELAKIIVPGLLFAVTGAALAVHEIVKARGR